MSEIKLIIVDDNFVVRRGLCDVFSLDKRFMIVGEVSNGNELLTNKNLIDTDVILMDIRMSCMDGVQTTREVLKQYPNIKILSLTSVEDPIILANIINAGAYGYMVYGTFQPDEMIEAVLNIYHGKKIYQPDLTTFFGDEINHTVSNIKAYEHESLTDRESDVLNLIGSGCDNATIASIMNINEKTVKNYISRIYSKLGVTDRREAILYSLSNMIKD